MSDEIKNPTRIEQYLSKAAGEDTDLPDAPMTRIEQYLAKIAGQDVELPDETYTRIEEYLKTIAENGGGGGETVLINNKNISANGEYSASSDGADGYKKVTVSVSNTYAAGDEGKVVSNGSLVSQTAHATVTQNGTIDTTLNNSVEVAVPVPIVSDDNLAKNATFEAGYLNTSGVMQPENPTTKEIISDKITIDPNATDIQLLVILDSYDSYGWCACGFYDSDGNFISRSSAGNQNGLSCSQVTIPANAASVRLMFRTYGHAIIYAAYSDKFSIINSSNYLPVEVNT